MWQCTAQPPPAPAGQAAAPPVLTTSHSTNVLTGKVPDCPTFVHKGKQLERADVHDVMHDQVRDKPVQKPLVG